MDILIQQDGRIQTNQAIRSCYRHRTVELAAPLSYAMQVSADDLPKRMPVIEREFRCLGTEGQITVWVEVR